MNKINDEEIMKAYDAAIAQGGSADSVIIRTCRALIKLRFDDFIRETKRLNLEIKRESDALALLSSVDTKIITQLESEIAALKQKVLELEGAYEGCVGACNMNKAVANNLIKVNKMLRTHIKQLQKDTGRYQWLRENVEKFAEELECVDAESPMPPTHFSRYVTAEECDAAIDAAMKEPK